MLSIWLSLLVHRLSPVTQKPEAHRFQLFRHILLRWTAFAKPSLAKLTCSLLLLRDFVPRRLATVPPKNAKIQHFVVFFTATPCPSLLLRDFVPRRHGTVSVLAACSTQPSSHFTHLCAELRSLSQVWLSLLVHRFFNFFFIFFNIWLKNFIKSDVIRCNITSLRS